jgi:1-deoxy-D-xylulose-5-phosphate reductoisomerase
MKGLCILGSTGSVGTNTLRVVESLPGEFRVAALSAGKNLALLVEQISKFHPSIVSVASSDCIEPLRNQVKAAGYKGLVKIVAGSGGQKEAATLKEVDFVVSASHGVTGLGATYEAVRAGKAVGLANKEVMVVAGELVTTLARERGVPILPIDSEHSAVHQCLRSGNKKEVRRLILTGSGGPFRKTPRKQLASVTPQQALKHPIWRMGARITIDSATLMNKGLEIIEARWLFGLEPSKIDVLIHPESIVHSMIEFQDGSIMAQLSVADMRLPIQYALTYPDRMSLNGSDLRLDMLNTRRLSFARPDTRRFPCLDLAREALAQGGLMPCAMNAADEVAVEAFLGGRLGFLGIPRVIEDVLGQTPAARPASLEEVFECDRESRRRAAEAVGRIQ